MLSSTHPKIWLAGGDADRAQPSNATWFAEVPSGRQWIPDGRGQWHTADNRHHASLAELRARYDLVETGPRADHVTGVAR